MLPGTCNCDPFARTKGSFCRNFHEQSSFFDGFPLLTAALSTPPDIWCQIVARFLISLIIELAIFVASIVEVREEGWTSGMRESGSIDKKKSSPLEPSKLIINEFQSNSQLTYAIHPHFHSL